MTNANDSITVSASELQALIANAVQNVLAQSNAPKTSAKVESPSKPSAMAIRPAQAAKQQAQVPAANDYETIRFEITEKAQKNKIKLPSGAFNNGGICVVDGVRYEAQANDQNRSRKINPKAIFGAEIGQTIVLDRIQKGKYVSTVEGKGQASAKTPAKAQSIAPKVDKPASKPAKLTDAVANIGKPSRPSKAVEKTAPAASKAQDKGNRIETVDEFLNHFEGLALAGFAAKHDDSAKLTKIEGLEADARAFLTTSQRIVFKGVRKSLGLGLKDAIEMLNERVYA